MLEANSFPIERSKPNITNEANIVFIHLGMYFLMNPILSIRFLVFFTMNHINTANTNGKMIGLAYTKAIITTSVIIRDDVTLFNFTMLKVKIIPLLIHNSALT